MFHQTNLFSSPPAGTWSPLFYPERDAECCRGQRHASTSGTLTPTETTWTYLMTDEVRQGSFFITFPVTLNLKTQSCGCSPALGLGVCFGCGVQSSQLGPVVRGGWRRRIRRRIRTHTTATNNQSDKLKTACVTDFCFPSASSRASSECWAGCVHCGTAPPENTNTVRMWLALLVLLVRKCRTDLGLFDELVELCEQLSDLGISWHVPTFKVLAWRQSC